MQGGRREFPFPTYGRQYVGRVGTMTDLRFGKEAFQIGPRMPRVLCSGRIFIRPESSGLGYEAAPVALVSNDGRIVRLSCLEED